MAGITAHVAAMRESFASGTTREIADRTRALEALARAIEAGTDALCAALAQDLGKSREEAMVTEIGYLLTEIAHIKKHLQSWVGPQKFSPGALLFPSSGKLVREPLGVALVIAPWNYPVNLALGPLIGAIGGGNTAILKPSEVTPTVSAALARLLDEHALRGWVRVVEGGVSETTTLLEQRFDVIFYTGNGRVGRIVAEAAAKHLTPTILELGGKSPAFVDEGVDTDAVAKRLAWGKFTNAGQTCVAPDYVLAARPVLDKLRAALAEQTDKLYGPDPKASPDYGRIVNRKHAERLAGLIDPDKVVLGGDVDFENRYVAPTILDGVSQDDRCMQEEIFGPILPLIEVQGADEAISIIQGGEKPLTLYVFSEDDAVTQRFVDETSSGSVAVGFTLAHLGSPTMPFGGVGESGMGAYHGKASIEAFTHLKPVVSKPLSPDTLAPVYPPYGTAIKVLERVLRSRKS